MENHNFKIGDKVKHKSTNDFEMVIVAFAVYWENNQRKQLDKIPNPKYPMCKYYDIYTNKWETKRFHYSELVSSNT